MSRVNLLPLSAPVKVNGINNSRVGLMLKEWRTLSPGIEPTPLTYCWPCSRCINKSRGNTGYGKRWTFCWKARSQKWCPTNVSAIWLVCSRVTHTLSIVSFSEPSTSKVTSSRQSLKYDMECTCRLVAVAVTTAWITEGQSKQALHEQIELLVSTQRDQVCCLSCHVPRVFGLWHLNLQMLMLPWSFVLPWVLHLFLTHAGVTCCCHVVHKC